jgi:hypothetical protein
MNHRCLLEHAAVGRLASVRIIGARPATVVRAGYPMDVVRQMPVSSGAS